MKASKKLFLAAALTGAMSASPALSRVSVACGAGNGPLAAEKEGCQGKGGDKAGCGAKGKHDKKEKGGDKAACSGKHGCGGKDKS